MSTEKALMLRSRITAIRKDKELSIREIASILLVEEQDLKNMVYGRKKVPKAVWSLLNQHYADVPIVEEPVEIYGNTIEKLLNEKDERIESLEKEIDFLRKLILKK